MIVRGGESPTKTRLDGPDFVRGLVMVLMLIDHTRLFVHSGALVFDPTDLSQTSAPVFLTRWITHFCAPLFVFLAGMSAAFQQQRGKSAAELSAFLFKRGVWLVVLELVLFRMLIFWKLVPSVLFLQVIWAVGIAMICLAGFVRMPRAVVLAIGASLVLVHNAFDGMLVPAWEGPDSPVPSVGAKLWMMLHQGGAFPVAGWPGPVALAQYPVLPWIGLMALGWLAGGLYAGRQAEDRQRMLLRLGAALTVAFVLLRWANVYGDPDPWASQSNAVLTALSFLNTHKYPPSLLFLLMTLGPGLMLLAWADRPAALRGTATRALITFGRVPLFFYALQWIYAKSAGFALAVFAGNDTSLFFQDPFDLIAPDGHGFGLGATYVVWAAGVVLLYWPCRWFAGVKARRRDWWLSYV